MKYSYGEQYKQLLAQAYAARVKQAAYRPHVINKRAALHLMQNPRLRELLYKRAGFWSGLGNVASTAFSLTPVGMLATQKGRGMLGKGLGFAAKGLGNLYGGATKGLGWLGSNAAKLYGNVNGGILKGLGSLTGINALSTAGDAVSKGWGKIGDGISGAANTVSGWQSGAGNAISGWLSGGSSSPAAGTTNNSANSSGSGGDSGVINSSAEG